MDVVQHPKRNVQKNKASTVEDTTTATTSQSNSKSLGLNVESQNLTVAKVKEVTTMN